MTNFNVSRAASSDMTNQLTSYEVTPSNTFGVQGTEFTEVTIDEWSKWYGAYEELGEFKRAIDVHTDWTLGKGYKADPLTKVILDSIKGYGKESFNRILKNMITTCLICGDSFAEVVRDPKTKRLTNLKVLDPSTMKIMVRDDGIIDHYIQRNKLPVGKTEQRFETDEIFHLSRNRVADGLRGKGVTQAVMWILEARKEALNDTRTFMHRYVKPMMKFMLDTDDQTKIDQFVAKMDRIVAKGENLYIPKDTVSHEVIQVNAGNLVPTEWIRMLHGFIYQAVGVPEFLMGSSSGTESNSKISYVTYQQTIENFQLEIEEAVYNQLYLKIELDFPATIQNELISDYGKDGANQNIGFQQNDFAAGAGR